jgi:hypothetical protein
VRATAQQQPQLGARSGPLPTADDPAPTFLSVHAPGLDPQTAFFEGLSGASDDLFAPQFARAAEQISAASAAMLGGGGGGEGEGGACAGGGTGSLRGLPVGLTGFDEPLLPLFEGDDLTASPSAQPARPPASAGEEEPDFLLDGDFAAASSSRAGGSAPLLRGALPTIHEGAADAPASEAARAHKAAPPAHKAAPRAGLLALPHSASLSTISSAASMDDLSSHGDFAASFSPQMQDAL